MKKPATTKTFHPPIQKLALLVHPTNIAVPKVVSVILQWAKTRKVDLFLEMETAQRLKVPELGVSRQVISRCAEMALVLGGDGTILQTARTFAGDHIPIAGINVGHLGFMTLSSSEDTIKILERLRRGQYHIEDRLMLSSRVKRNGRVVHEAVAVNDVVVVKEPISRIIDVEVSISGTKISIFRGDGIIISSPTGSTAYSLSSGGPIIPPWVNALLLTPLASHTLYARPVITSDHEVFSAKLSCIHSKIDLVIDGQEGFKLQNNDIIEVGRAPGNAKIVVLQPRNFFKILRKKMKWGK